MAPHAMRRLISSGSPLEPRIGFSRAVRVGPFLAVAGTAPIASDGGVSAPGDVYGQTKRCLEIVAQAILDAGFTLQSVVRTRVMLTDISRWEEAARAHGELFAGIKPACTFVEVKGFIDREWLVELEADCFADTVPGLSRLPAALAILALPLCRIRSTGGVWPPQLSCSSPPALSLRDRMHTKASNLADSVSAAGRPAAALRIGLGLVVVVMSMAGMWLQLNIDADVGTRSQVRRSLGRCSPLGLSRLLDGIHRKRHSETDIVVAARRDAGAAHRGTAVRRGEVPIAAPDHAQEIW